MHTNHAAHNFFSPSKFGEVYVVIKNTLQQTQGFKNSKRKGVAIVAMEKK